MIYELKKIKKKLADMDFGYRSEGVSHITVEWDCFEKNDLHIVINSRSNIITYDLLHKLKNRFNADGVQFYVDKDDEYNVGHIYITYKGVKVDD